MGIDINRLGAAAQAQVRDQLAQREKQKRIAKTRQAIPKDDFGSNLEREFYDTEIWPRIQTGEIVTVELQRTFLLLQSEEFCGIKLPAAHYTPDFVVEYKNGDIVAIEIKHKKIRKLQRDYIYRRRLFIELYAKPNHWYFREVITG